MSASDFSSSSQHIKCLIFILLCKITGSTVTVWNNVTADYNLSEINIYNDSAVIRIYVAAVVGCSQFSSFVWYC